MHAADLLRDTFYVAAFLVVVGCDAAGSKWRQHDDLASRHP